MAIPAAATSTENRLAGETSPYLLQHKHNPVDWWPWGPAALAEATQTGKPILLSVGYAACHWCHVMAHESFEDDATAAVMNELFVNIKVDREERPDIDQIYMNALHLLGEQGGWPLTMFLTPGRRAGVGRHLLPQDRALRAARLRRRAARGGAPVPRGAGQDRAEPQRPDGAARRARAARQPRRHRRRRARQRRQARRVALIDPVHGGMRGAPKFPNASLFELLWRAGLRSRRGTLFRRWCEITLDRICEGGIYDHLGGGFSRYSVDERWLVPHFEKMLYDNAQLLELLALAHARTAKPLYRERARETVDWLVREMTGPEGALLRLARRQFRRRGRQVLRLVAR